MLFLHCVHMIDFPFFNKKVNIFFSKSKKKKK